MNEALNKCRKADIPLGLLIWSVYIPERIREVAFGESRGRLFGLVRLDLLLQIGPFASVQELVTSAAFG
jgi:hypothetical protein